MSMEIFMQSFQTAIPTQKNLMVLQRVRTNLAGASAALSQVAERPEIVNVLNGVT